MTEPAPAAQLAELQAWCLGSAGRAQARAALQRIGLPADSSAVDDLCQETYLKVWQRLGREPLAPDPAGGSAVAAYATVVGRNTANDWLRRSRREHLDGLLDLETIADEPIDDRPHDPNPADLDPALVGIGLFGLGGPGRDLRRTLARHLAERPRRLAPWTLSATLVVLHLTGDAEVALLPGVPVPDPRSPAKHDRARWAGLAYAGRGDCFDQPETGAVRQRRSVALQRLDATLRAAIESVTTSGRGGS